MKDVYLTEKNIVLPSYRGRLLEGITYDSNTHSILWVDIILAQVHRLQLDTQKHQIIQSTVPGDSIGTIGLTDDDDKVVLGDKTGVGVGSFETGEIVTKLKYPENDKVRSNDGKLDPYGNLIIGTMYNFYVPQSPIGSLYQVKPGWKLSEMKTECFIPNGLGFTQDETFYWTDTIRGHIFKYKYDHETAQMTDETVFFSIKDHFGDGHGPDGMCISSKDNFFISIFNGSCVMKVNKDGEVIGKFHVPGKQITCCTIGGKDGDELWITCAHQYHEDMSKDINEVEEDLGGYLYMVKLDESEPEIQYRWKLD